MHPAKRGRHEMVRKKGKLLLSSKQVATDFLIGAIPLFCSTTKMSFSHKHNIFDNVKCATTCFRYKQPSSGRHFSTWAWHVQCLKYGIPYCKHFTLLKTLLCFWLNDILGKSLLTTCRASWTNESPQMLLLKINKTLKACRNVFPIFFMSPSP